MSTPGMKIWSSSLTGSGGGGGGSFVSKSGEVLAASFAGSPQKATVTFVAPYATANYTIVFGGEDARNITFESKTVNGFVINLNAATAPTGSVEWFTAPYGETS